MNIHQSEVAHMRFLGYSFIFAQAQPLFYNGVQTGVLNSQILSAQRIAQILKKEQKYQMDSDYRGGLSIKDAADLQRLHQDLKPVLEKEHEGLRWRDRLSQIIEGVEMVGRGERPQEQIINMGKSFFKDMLHYTSLRNHQLEAAYAFF